MNNNQNKYGKIILYTILILRILSIGLLWVDVLLGYIVCGLLDGVDGDILGRVGYERNWYQKFDKRLDQLFYTGLFIYGLLYFPQNVIYWVLFFTFIIRIVGYFIYEKTYKEWLLFVFPNIFSYLFLIVIAIPSTLEWDFVFKAPITMLLLLTIYTLIREWVLHVAKYDVSAWIPGVNKKW